MINELDNWVSCICLHRVVMCHAGLDANKGDTCRFGNNNFPPARVVHCHGRSVDESRLSKWMHCSEAGAATPMYDHSVIRGFCPVFSSRGPAADLLCQDKRRRHDLRKVDLHIFGLHSKGLTELVSGPGTMRLIGVVQSEGNPLDHL